MEEDRDARPVRRYRMTVEYDGRGFEGWQLQATGRTVQGALEAAIEQVTRKPVRVHGAGRTDAGVHALGQVCHFDSDTGLSAEKLKRALNGVMTDDLGVVDLRVADPRFDARRDALRKRYRYRVLNRAEPSPLRRLSTWHIRRALDVGAMRRAAALLVGEHDFAAFRGAPSGPPPPESTIRTLDRLELIHEGDELQFLAEGRSFLRYMVRNLVGTLVEVGREKRGPEGVQELFESGARERAGPTAPAHGLCLVRVAYPGDPPS